MNVLSVCVKWTNSITEVSRPGGEPHLSCFMALRHFLLTLNWFAAPVSDSRVRRTQQEEQLRCITASTGFSVLFNSALLSPKYVGLFVSDASELPDEELPACIFG